MSTDSEPRKRPVSPPMAKRKRKDRAYSIGAASRIEPLYIVASQLKTLTAEGIATEKVRAEKIMFISPDWPLVNMWWPQTKKLRRAIAIDDQAMNL